MLCQHRLSEILTEIAEDQDYRFVGDDNTEILPIDALSINFTFPLICAIAEYRTKEEYGKGLGFEYQVTDDEASFYKIQVFIDNRDYSSFERVSFLLDYLEEKAEKFNKVIPISEVVLDYMNNSDFSDELGFDKEDQRVKL